MHTSKGLDGQIRAELQSGENPLTVASLRIPKRFTTATSWFAIIVFVRLFDEIRNLVNMRRFRRKFEEIQFPIARKMTVCITERRILLWKQSILRPRNNFIGTVDRNRVLSSEVMPSSHVKWNVITIQFLNGPQVRFLIDHESAQKLSDELNATPN